MIKQLLLFSSLLLLFLVKGFGQSIFINEGKIEFERRLSVYKDIEGTELETYKGTLPPFFLSMHQLYFKNGKSLYQRDGMVDNSGGLFKDYPSLGDKIYTDIDKKIFSHVTSMSDVPVVLTDSSATVKWIIKNELREIAGFECVRAEGIFCDSLFVIAFFSHQIPVSGGPMKFSGLPGMILGIVIPRLHLTVFATKLELNVIDENKIVYTPTSSGQVINYTTFKRYIDQEVKKINDNRKNGLLRRLF